jgi:ferredoxin
MKSCIRRFAGKRFFVLLGVLSLGFSLGVSADEVRFPAPEFDSNYTFPDTWDFTAGRQKSIVQDTTPLYGSAPAPTTETQQWVDVAVLILGLSLAAWLAVKRRSRRGLFWLMLFSLGYFGFYKEGCVCPIGSIQNIALSLFSSNYAAPITVVIFFVAPLVFALFFGRVFCASICALGAIQDLVVLKPIQLPRKLTVALSMIPYVYIGTAILFAATNTGFIICRYDPFIGFFRLNGNAPYLYLGAGFLLVGVFIARPYCRFFCPYGVLLGLMSRFSRRHLAITPSECVDCRLCEVSCPFDYINKPNTGLEREGRSIGVQRLAYLFAMIPVMVVLGGWIGHEMSVPMSRYNNTVFLAEQIQAEKADPAMEASLETTTFRSMGKPEEKLLVDAEKIRAQMNMGGWLLGGFLGLVFSLKLIGISMVRSQKDYEVNKSTCFSCGRCCSYCPSDDMHKINFLPGSKALKDSLALADPRPEEPEKSKALKKGKT